MNIAKKILITVLAAFTLLSVASCSSSEDANTLVMATNAYFPPYEYYENDKVVGIDPDIMEAICADLGMTLKIEDMEFDSIITAVQSGKADIGVAGMTVTEDRLLSVSFTDPYTTAKQVIIVTEDSPIATPDDLAGKTIGVQTGTTGDIVITGDYEDEGLATVERYNKGNEAVLALTQGKIDAVVIDNEPAKVFVETNEGLKILETEYITEEYAIAVNKENTELLEKLNASLAKLKESGKLDEIIGNYIKAE